MAEDLQVFHATVGLKGNQIEIRGRALNVVSLGTKRVVSLQMARGMVESAADAAFFESIGVSQHILVRP